MKQQCHLAMIYIAWAVFLGGLGFLAWRSMWLYALLWLVLAPAAQWLYIRKFPSMSPMMGYGQIEDVPAPPSPQATAVVRLYTALGCPFCPLIDQRLEDLKSKLGFTLEKIDVTLRPDLLASKGICSVPVVEANGKLLFGLATTRDLAALIEKSEVHTN